MFAFLNTFKAQFTNAIPNNGLIGYWSFDDNFEDSGANRLVTVNNGVVLSNDNQGNANKACYLNGNSFLAIKDNELLRPKQITINVMVKAEIIDELTNPLFYKGQFEVYELDLKYFGIKQNSGCVSYSGGGWIMTDKNPTIKPNTWYMVTGSFDGKNLKYYVDGKLIKSKSTDVSIIDNCPGGEDFRVGRRHNMDKVQFKGSVDELGIWNRALTDEEILKIYKELNQPFKFLQQPNLFEFSFEYAAVNEKGKINIVVDEDLKKIDEDKKTKLEEKVPMAFRINNESYIYGFYTGEVVKVKTELGKVYVPHNKGEFVAENPEELFYNGQWKFGKFTSDGSLTYKINNKKIEYVGRFENGKLNGQGRIKLSNLFRNLVYW
ncbi:MAG: LamG-like jellyroll fold domain-containing protein [Bacteroidota bacterium]